ncbi:putative oxidoreductase YteT isoform X1 [Branchiostoma floridae x Branchiostoma japonicum]
MSRTPVSALIIGAGVRGETYAQYALNNSDRLQVVGVADPRLFRCRRLQHLYNIPEENVFSDWREAADREKFADCVVIATPDQLHRAPAVAFADRGYHILLEKPMAVTEEDCRQIVSACERNRVILSVCHVLRYYPPVQKIKELIDSGAIGDVVNIHHMEPVGFWHFAHSFVRGNWRNTADSSFSLLAKCCHDVDLIRYWLTGSRCIKVSSFGSLLHFTPENKPAGAAGRCLDCQVENTCPYSAKKIYLRRVEQGQTGWPVSVVCPQEPVDIESLTEALRTGPYGRCVYECDNDVISNQVVNFQFEGGQTACLNMVAFTQEIGERQTRIAGTKGELRCSGAGPVYLYDFLKQEETKHDCAAAPSSRMGDMLHGGADFFLMDAFVKAIQSGDRSHILTGPQDTLQSHLLVFAAEQARLQDRVIKINADGSFEFC